MSANEPVWDGTGVPPLGLHPTPAEYDPADHTVPEVLDHLAGLDDGAEYDRIVAAETDGRARSTLLDNLPERPSDEE